MKSKKKFVLAGLLLLAVIITGLALTGCETEVDPSTPQQEQTGGNSGNSGNSGGGNTQQPGGDNTGNGGNNSGGEDEVGGEKPVTYTVTFNTNGGSEVASQTVESGQKASPPAEPELEGSWFLGWYGDKELTTEFDFSAPVTADTTVYAKWSYRLHTKPTELTEYTGSEWTYVEFGDWPQTIMADGVIVDETKSKTIGGLTYYLGNDGNHYVKQEEKAYNAGYTYSDGTTVGQDGTTTKWFKVEPIVWRVLTEDYKDPDGNSTGTALLLAENILTGGIPYYVDKDTRTITMAGTKEGEPDTVYANNYQYSTVRAWLNGKYERDDTQTQTYNGTGFLQSAFTADAQALIAQTTVDNSAASTTDAGDNLTQATEYACADTSDKIFLLSEREVTTEGYGFAAYNVYKGDSKGTTTSTRIRVTTDYAKATGAYQSSTEGYGGWWWLRSPYYNLEISARSINGGGNAYIGYVYFADGGVVPALCVELW